MEKLDVDRDEDGATDEPEARPPERRHLPRRSADFGVSLTGGGLTLSGQAVDVSRQGLGVRLDAWPTTSLLAAPKGAAGSAADRIRTAFGLGVVLEFRGREVRVPARLARIDGVPGAGPPPLLGLHFARALAEDEWTRLSTSPTPKVSARATLRAVRRGSMPLVLSILDTETTGMLTVELTAAGADPTAGDVVEGQINESPLESIVRARCGAGARPARIQSGTQVLWVGTTTLCGVRSTGRGLVGRFLAAPALGPAVRAWVEGG